MPPLFFCCQNKFEVTNLAACLAPNRPVYAMRSTGSLIAATDVNIRALASHYVKDLLKVQENGAFFLAGHCAGARVAWEIARQLIALGRPVALLALIDRDLDSSSRSFSLSAARFVFRSRIRLRAYLEMTDETMPVRLRHILAGVYKVLSRGVKRVVSPVASLLTEPASEKAYFLTPLPDPFSGRVILFYVRGSEYSFFRYRMFHRHWSRLALGKYDVVMISGRDHFDPNWSKVAETINSHFASTETRSDKPPQTGIAIQGCGNESGLDVARL
ncbi:MAG: thioesterase domain-containing protein [Beijerinckiaceae bacterium]|nr:thioesterase domain-containing protein [Beijerinckiaceae bacterium]